MSRTIASIMVMVAAARGSAQPTPSCTPNDAAAAAAVRARLAAWVNQANANDRTAMRDVWAPGLVGWFPSASIFGDSAAYAAAGLPPARGTPRVTYEIDIDDIVASGSVVSVHDVWNETRELTPTASVRRTIRSSELWRCQPDGKWRIARYVSAPEPWTRVGTGGAPFDAPKRVDLATSTVVVPLQKDGEFYFTPVSINGRPFRFTIETGASFVAISSAAARALGLPLDSMDMNVIGGQTRRSPIVRIDSVSVGGATFRGLTASVNPAWDNQGFDGIISVPYFQDLLVSLELSKSRLMFSRGTLPEPNGRDVLPIARRDRAGRIDVDLDLDGVRVPAVVDTRSFIPLTIPDSLVGSLRTESPPQSIGGAAGPALGAFELRGARLSGDARIGAVGIARPPIAFRNRPGSVIGVPILEQLDLTFDVAHARVRVASAGGGAVKIAAQPWEAAGARTAAGPPPPTAASGQRTMGFNMAGFPGAAELRVVNVVRGSDAERVGLKNDDMVVEFDGIPVARINPQVFRAAAARDTPTKIVVRRGTGTLTFSIKPYVVP